MNRVSEDIKQNDAGKIPHSIVLEQRRNLTVCGVLSVLSCDSFGVTVETPEGMLAIGGEGLSVSELSVRSGEIRVSGKIEYLQYSEKREKAASLFRRLVR